MNFGPYLLPSMHRGRHEELERYVRNEYREDNSCWFAAENGHGPCVRLPGETVKRTEAQADACCSGPRRAEVGTCCPVLNAISKSGAITGKPSRGETSGRL